jgi:hypothetical protein
MKKNANNTRNKDNKKSVLRQSAIASLKKNNPAINESHLKVFNGMVDFLLKLFESNGKGQTKEAYSIAKEFINRLAKMRVLDPGKNEKRPLTKEEIESFEIIAQTAFSFYKSKGMKNFGGHGFKGAKDQNDAFALAFTSAKKIFESEGKKLFEN